MANFIRFLKGKYFMNGFRVLILFVLVICSVSCQTDNRAVEANSGNKNSAGVNRDVVPSPTKSEPAPTTINEEDEEPRLTGDAIRGKNVYSQCLACHNLQRNAVGPRHCGVFGRKAGGVDDFDYSDAMKSSNRVWNYRTMNDFLADPQKKIPGNLMFYPGISSEQDRLDIIAYLESVSKDKAVCP